MKYNYFFKFYLLFLLVTSQAFAQVNVTFKVDMTGQTVSANGVQVTGSINGWSDTSNVLTKEGETNIYSGVVTLNTGWHEYKFLNGGWENGITEAPEAPCTLWGNNRLLYINDSGEDVVLDPVLFDECNASGTGFTVSFNVDMSSETSVSGDGIHLAGEISNWDDWKITVGEVVDAANAIYGVDLTMSSPSDYPVKLVYKYINGWWGNEETPLGTCPTVDAEYSNRVVTVSSSGQTLYDVFNGCNYSLGLDDFNQIGLTSIYNKNTRSLSFISEGVIDSIAKIQIFDMSGKRVHNLTKINNLNTAKIDLNGTPNGLYFVQAEINGSDYVKKVLVY